MILILDYNGNFNPKTQDLACIIYVVYIRYDAQAKGQNICFISIPSSVRRITI